MEVEIGMLTNKSIFLYETLAYLSVCVCVFISSEFRGDVMR